jgi:CRISPR-associated protein Cas2
VRSVWLVCYDICDARRLRRVYRLLRGFGDWVQLSVFRCELSESELTRLQGMLETEIHHEEDQVLFAYLGPAVGKGAESVHTIGRVLDARQRIVVL